MGKRKRTPKSTKSHDTPKQKRSGPSDGKWLLWGPYLSERQWGTVREDVSEDSNCWESFPHNEAPYRAYQYGEDGLFGLSDDQAQLCLSLALWNGKDPILKERLFGLTGPQGNHGEDVKECYYYLRSSPSHSYMKALYKYPMQEYPYQELVQENANRRVEDTEYELIDTGVLDSGQYFDVTAEYCKNSPQDILCQYTVHNRSDQDSDIDIIPQLCFRNTWTGNDTKITTEKPKIITLGENAVMCLHNKLGKYIFEYSANDGNPQRMFTENETNERKLTKQKKRQLGTKIPSSSSSSKLHTGFKDAFHEHVVKGNISALNQTCRGTKFGALYHFTIPASSHVTIRCRLVSESEVKGIDLEKKFNEIMQAKTEEYNMHINKVVSPMKLSSAELEMVSQAYAGLCWNKQFFGYDVSRWLKSGQNRINSQWGHMINNDVISMPDKWEFPWYATWDLAFHMIPFADIDVEFAKEQLLLFLNQRYIHPNGQLPAYEFDFSDVNPPVHALACLHVYRQDKDTSFLKRCFNKLMLNFNWWVNSKQIDSSFLFGGGFLGMDNISCLHRSALPPGCSLYQVDGTCWMAFYALCMLDMALELCREEEGYTDMVVMYLDYFLSIAYALNHGLNGNGLWDEKDQFFYDVLKTRESVKSPSSFSTTGTSLLTPGSDTSLLNPNVDKFETLRVRALIGLSTLFPVLTIKQEVFEKIPSLQTKVEELFSMRTDMLQKLGMRWEPGNSLFLSVLSEDKLRCVLKYLVDEEEFLSPHGIRSLSKFHRAHPFSVTVNGEKHSVNYNPAESCSDMFGGNSNWRGPIWFPMNYLLVESLEALYAHYGQSLSLEFPARSGKICDLSHVSGDICQRLVSLFLPDSKENRPCHGTQKLYSDDPHFKDLILFYEYFDGDNGRGCGANHQTGWTALVVTLLRKLKTLNRF